MRKCVLPPDTPLYLTYCLSGSQAEAGTKQVGEIPANVFLYTYVFLMPTECIHQGWQTQILDIARK